MGGGRGGEVGGRVMKTFGERRTGWNEDAASVQETYRIQDFIK